MSTPSKQDIDTIETTDPQQAKRFEQELASRGVSYMTQIVKTKREGLRYVIKILSQVDA